MLRLFLMKYEKYKIYLIVFFFFFFDQCSVDSKIFLPRDQGKFYPNLGNIVFVDKLSSFVLKRQA